MKLISAFVLLALALGVSAQTMTAVSQINGVLGNGQSSSCDINEDGRFVIFTSASTNLNAADTNGVTDVYLFDVQTGVTELVSQGTNGAGGAIVLGNANSNFAEITSDGDYVAFTSASTTFFMGAPAGVSQIYLRNRDDDTTTLVSRATGAAGAAGDANSSLPSVSDDGELVTFSTSATNLGGTMAQPQIALRDLDDDTSSVISRASGAAGVVGNGLSVASRITEDGDYVVFATMATNLGGVVTGTGNVYHRSLDDDTTTLVSVPAPGGSNLGMNGFAGLSISSNGRYVAFSSTSTLVAGDTNGVSDIYVRDIEDGVTTRVSVATGGVQANGASQNPHLSANGDWVVFGSTATNLVAGDTNGQADIFLHSRVTGITSRVSTNVMGAEAMGGASTVPRISGDSSLVCFTSAATNLIAVDGNGVTDVFLAVGNAGGLGNYF